MARRIPALLAGLLTLAIVLPGCRPTNQAARPHDGPPTGRDKDNAVENGVTIEDDAKKSRIRFIGTKAPYGRGTGGANVYLLRSWLDRATGELSHQVYVTDRYLAASTRNWSRATGAKGERLKFNKIDTQLENCSPAGCPRLEAFGAGIDDGALRAAAGRGFTIEFAAEDGSKESITLTPEQITNQLEAIDHKRASLPPPPTGKPAPKKNPAKKAAPVFKDTGY